MDFAEDGRQLCPTVSLDVSSAAPPSTARLASARGSVPGLDRRLHVQAPCLVEAFSGSGRLGTIAHWARWRSMSSDTLHIPAGDLLNEAKLAMLCGWFRTGRAQWVHTAPSCSTFSILYLFGPRARQRNTRTEARPEGGGTSQAEVLGTACAGAAARLLEAARGAGALGTHEHPAGSWMWRLPSFQRLAATGAWHRCGWSHCAFGANWRKHSELWSTDASVLDLCRSCPGGPGHSPHPVVLFGKVKQRGRWVDRTAVAAAYPGDFRRALVTRLGRGAVATRRDRHRAPRGERPAPIAEDRGADSAREDWDPAVGERIGEARVPGPRRRSGPSLPDTSIAHGLVSGRGAQAPASLGSYPRGQYARPPEPWAPLPRRVALAGAAAWMAWGAPAGRLPRRLGLSPLAEGPGAAARPVDGPRPRTLMGRWRAAGRTLSGAEENDAADPLGAARGCRVAVAYALGGRVEKKREKANHEPANAAFSPDGAVALQQLWGSAHRLGVDPGLSFSTLRPGGATYDYLINQNVGPMKGARLLEAGAHTGALSS